MAFVILPCVHSRGPTPAIPTRLRFTNAPMSLVADVEHAQGPLNLLEFSGALLIAQWLVRLRAQQPFSLSHAPYLIIGRWGVARG